jgi:hypothetical protein
MPARESPKDDNSDGSAAGGGGSVEAASYVSEAITELARLAERHDLDMLCYLLEMAKLEADDVVRRHGTKPESS